MKKLISILLLLAICLTAFAACNKGPSEELIAAGDYLYGLYKDEPTKTPSDFDVAGRVMVGTTVYTVEWSVNVTEGVTIKESEKAGFMTIDVNEKTETDINYTLTATIKDEKGVSVEKSFERTVPAYKVFSYAEYAAAENDATVVVKGIITGIFSKTNGSSGNGIYIQDMNNEGGYYVYGLVDAKDPEADLGLKVGMTVEASGLKALYNGLYEVVDASIEILDETIKTVEPVDYTDAFIAAETLADEALVGKQSMLVTIKGVEITGQDLSNGYYKFALGGKESYVRISSSNNCITKDEQATFKAAHTDNFGYIANVTGIVQLYNGNLYLIPATVDAFTGFALPERSDAEKVEMEVGNITLADRITENTEIALPATGSTYAEVTYAWASDNACAVIADGKLTITLPEENATVTITLTAKCGELTETKTFTLKVDAAATDLYIAKPTTTPAADTAYKFFLVQGKLGKTLYVTGEVDGRYLVTTDKADQAADVYVETVEGGVKFYILVDGTKQYITIYNNDAGKLSVKYDAAGTSVFAYNADVNAWVSNMDGTDYYLGTYNNFNTISASKLSYITAENTGVSQFPAGVATLAPATYVNVPATAPVADTAYKFFLVQGKLGKTLYVTGEVDGRYLVTTDKADQAADVYVETVEGGVKFYILVDGAKQYITIYNNDAGKLSVKYDAAGTSVYAYNADVNAWVSNMDGTDYYLGTYNNFNTISASKLSYITAENTGVSQFPAGVATLEAAEVAPVAATAPVADTAYKFALIQGKLGGKTLYVTGEVDGRYLVTTDKISKAADVYVETVEGGVKFYILVDGAKQYITIYNNDAGKLSVKYDAAGTSVFAYNADVNAWVSNMDGTDYYLGTYNNFNTISASKLSYITVENTGVSQFPAGFFTIEIVK